jgi:hypothetical protein
MTLHDASMTLTTPENLLTQVSMQTQVLPGLTSQNGDAHDAHDAYDASVPLLGGLANCSPSRAEADARWRASLAKKALEDQGSPASHLLDSTKSPDSQKQDPDGREIILL